MAYSYLKVYWIEIANISNGQNIPLTSPLALLTKTETFIHTQIILDI